MFTLPAPENPLAEFGSAMGGSLLNRYLQNQESTKINNTIQDAFKDIGPETSPLDVVRTVSGLNVPQQYKDMLIQGFQNVQQQREGLRKRESESLQSRKIANQFGIPEEEIEGLSPQHALELGRIKSKPPVSPQDRQALEDEFIKSGMPQAWAHLAANATEGGRTAIIKDWIDTKNRLGPNADLAKPPDISESKQASSEETEKLEDFDKGLNPRERVVRQNARFTTQTPMVQELENSIHSLEESGLKLQRLVDLNEDLPEGLERWNVSFHEGKLRIPAAASPEAQLYVKTINDFTSSAKDSYGARVTNFDLQQFMSRLPTLSNTKEGREVILKQMQIINELNALEKKATLDQIDKYGIRNIDFSKAQSLGKANVAKEKKRLIEEFHQLDGFFDKQERSLIQNMKSDIPEGYLLMKGPEGNFEYVRKDKVNSRKKEGWKTR